jgi:hypothetical protein
MKRKQIDESLAAAEAASETDSFDSPVSPAAERGDDRRGILVRVAPSIRRELKVLSAERGTSVQVLMVQAINELLARNGRRPIA